MSDKEDLAGLGAYIRAQREMAQLSVRNLARMANLSDSYLSQVERGLYQPSAEVVQQISQALGLQTEELFRRMGWLGDEQPERTVSTVPESITADERLSKAQKSALIQMYRTMVDDV